MCGYDRRFLIFVAGLLVSLAACTGPGASPQQPCTVTFSQQAANNLLQRIAQQAAVRGKPVTITATNDEVSSLLDQYLTKAKLDNPNDVIPLNHPTVCFQGGQMALYGAIQWGTNSTVDGLITLSASVSAGKPVFTVDQIQLGPVSVPPDLSNEVARVINQAVSEYVNQITLSDIKMQNGQLTLTGQVQ